MKIAIPAENESMDTLVCPSFGRTPYYLIYDTENKQSIFIENQAAKSQGGAGIQAAQILVDQKVQAVLTPRCGKNAAEVIQAANINIYRSVQASLQENISHFLSGKLEPLEEIHPGFHKHGGL